MLEYMLKDEKRFLGNGAYSRVYKSKCNGEDVAVKFIHKDQKKFVESYVQDELGAMMTLEHPNILTALKVFETVTDIAIVMPYCKDDLLTLLIEHKYFNECEAKEAARQLISGISYLHDMGWVHRDLKLDNILFHNGKYIIADWSFACEYQPSQKLSQSVGSLYYASPEILEGKPYYAPPVDIWSLGVILYGLLCGYLPFDSRMYSDAEIRKKIKIGAYDEIGKKISGTARLLIRSMLTVNPEQRATANQIKNHPWFSQVTPQLKKCSKSLVTLPIMMSNPILSPMDISV